MDYLEDKDGNIFNGDMAKSVRDFARAIFVEMDANGGGGMKLPEKWAGVGMVERKFFLRELYNKYPFIKFCENDWKALYLASRALSTYHSSKKRKGKANTVKTEQVDDVKPALTASTDAAETTDTSAKRKAPSEDANPAAKRARTSVDPIDVDLVTTTATSPSAASLPLHTITTTTTTNISSSNISTSPVDVSSPTPLPTSVSSSPLQPIDNTSSTATATSPTQPLATPTVHISRSSTPLSPITDTTPDRPSTPLEFPTSPNLGSPATKKDNDGLGKETTRSAPAGPAAHIEIENPFASLFGPASGPAARIESLQAAASTKKTVAKKGPTANSVAQGNEKKGGSAGGPAKAFLPGMKKPTNSSSPKNLYYIEYLKENDPITPAIFEEIWKTLDKENIKKYNDLSKQAKKN